MSKQLLASAIAGLKGRPALIHFDEAGSLETTLQLMAEANAREEKEAIHSSSVFAGSYYDEVESNRQSKPFLFAGGTAVIPVTGMLINRFNYSWSFVTGYDFIRAQLQAAVRDPDVERVVLDVNSAGGHVFGLQELADEVYAAREEKPILAYVNSYAFSAAYWLASAASKVYITPSGMAANIGAVMIHTSFEKMLKESGIAMTLVYSGKHKVDGNPYKDLPSDVRERFQAEIDDARNRFAAAVAKHRGLDVESVLATEAATYSAEEALSLDLVDAIQPPSEALQAFIDELNGSQTSQENIQMTTAKNPAAASEANSAAAPDAQTTQTATAPAAPAAAAPAAPAVDAAAAAAESRQAERSRIQGILACDEAKGKQALANHLAMTTDLSLEAIKPILSAAAPEAAAPAAAAGDMPTLSADMTGLSPNGVAASSDEPKGDAPTDSAKNASAIASFFPSNMVATKQ